MAHYLAVRTAFVNIQDKIDGTANTIVQVIHSFMAKWSLHIDKQDSLPMEQPSWLDVILVQQHSLNSVVLLQYRKPLFECIANRLHLRDFSRNARLIIAR